MARKFVSRATAVHRIAMPPRVVIPTEEQIQSRIIAASALQDAVQSVKPEPIIEPAPVVEPEPVIEPEPIIEPEPVVEPEPIIEHEPVVEPEPIIEPDPVVEPAPVVEPEPADKKYTIAILFRGTIRGDVNTVIEFMQHSIDELRANNHIVHAYLATWGTTHDPKINTLLSAIKFENVILQTAPALEQIQRFVKKSAMGCYPISNMYRMYYQTKTALDVITSAYNYDYIIHSRTDVKVTFGEHITNWLVKGHYTSPPSGAPWLCDWVGAAESKIMKDAWDYGTLERLGQLLDEKHVPEHIFIDLMSAHSIQHRTAPVASIFLDPNRVEPGDRV